jgi:quinol monooxygenase YgiN
MIRHVVMWKLKDPEVAPRFKALLDSCLGLTEGMLRYEVGIRAEGLEGNVDVMLVSEFRDTAALAAYQSHPQHQRVSAELGPLRESRHVLDVAMVSPQAATQ